LKKDRKKGGKERQRRISLRLAQGVTFHPIFFQRLSYPPSHSLPFSLFLPLIFIFIVF
jgi:hypothetical protein